MAIVTNELKFYKSSVFNDLSTNGNRMSNNVVTSGALGNAFPAIQEAERTAGSTKYRKFFMKVANDADLTLLTPKIFVVQFTPGDDLVVVHPGTQTDIQSDLTGSEAVFGSGKLNSAVSASAVSVDVAVEDDSVARIFRTTEEFVIFDLNTGGSPDIVSGVGNMEFRTIDTLNFVGDVGTLNFTGGLDNAYGTANTYVASVMPSSDILGSYASFVVTSGAGTYDDTTYPIVIDNIGGVYDSWTLTFSSATAFDCSGANEGAVGSGNVSSSFAPSNVAFGKPYFTMDSAGWGGTFTGGDTVTFTTSPPAFPFWAKRIVPAGAASLSPNNWIMGVIGSSSGA